MKRFWVRRLVALLLALVIGLLVMVICAALDMPPWTAPFGLAVMAIAVNLEKDLEP